MPALTPAADEIPDRVDRNSSPRDSNRADDVSVTTACPSNALPSDGIVVESDVPYAELVDRRTLPVRMMHAAFQSLEWVFGLLSLLVGLAVLATLPVVQLVSLGYLLEASGRASRTGRIRDGLLGVRRAARIGSLVLGTWLMLLPLWLISDYWYAAHLIDSASGVARGWRIALLVCTAVMVTHIVTAWYCGGRLRHFFWPLLAPFSLTLWLFRSAIAQVAVEPPVAGARHGFLHRLLADLGRVRPLSEWFLPAMLLGGLRRGRMVARCRDAVWEFAVSLRLPHLFWLGLRGFCGTMVYLVIPVLLLIGGTVLSPPGGVLAGWIGALLLLTMLLYLPFLQTHFAAENRWGALFEVQHVRALFRRAPLAFLVALVVTLLSALPLYLLMIEATPSEVAFVPGVIFVAFIFPARLLTGWAVGRARRRESPRHWCWRWFARLAALPAAAAYVWIVFLTRYTSWHGVWSLFEQHALLIPVPMLSL